MNTLAVVLLQVLSLWSSVALSSSECHLGNPSNRSLHEQWTRHITQERVHESVFLTSLKIADLSSSGKLNLDSREEDNTVGHCDSIKDLSSFDLQNRAFCPWYYRVDKDPDRYPVDLAQAKCRCEHGVGLGNQATCEEMNYNIRVLRKTGECDAWGHYEYESAWERVSAGCTTTVISKITTQ